MKKFIVGLFLAFSLFACTENSMVKSFGGKGTLELEPNEKLVNVTWKNDELWLLTRTMTVKDTAVTYNFREKSSFGFVEGSYTIIEIKK